MSQEEKIESAARKYAEFLGDGLYYGESPITRARIHAFKKGAEYALNNQWTSIKEKLPNFGQLVLVDGDCGIKISIYMNVFNDATQITQVVNGVTHWMEVPELNKQETEK